MKKYGNLDTANAIAAKLSESKGVKHVTKQHEGQFVVVTEAEAASMDTKAKADAKAAKSAAKAKPATTGTATVAKAQKADANGAEIVTVKIEGAKVTPEYVITQELGGRPRWFQRTRLAGVKEVDGGVEITCARSEFTSRKLGHLVAA